MNLDANHNPGMVAQILQPRLMQIIAFAHIRNQIAGNKAMVIPVSVAGSADPAVFVRFRIQRPERIMQLRVKHGIIKAILPRLEHRIAWDMIRLDYIQVAAENEWIRRAF